MKPLSPLIVKVPIVGPETMRYSSGVPSNVAHGMLSGVSSLIVRSIGAAVGVSWTGATDSAITCVDEAPYWSVMVTVKLSAPL